MQPQPTPTVVPGVFNHLQLELASTSGGLYPSFHQPQHLVVPSPIARIFGPGPQQPGPMDASAAGGGMAGAPMHASQDDLFRLPSNPWGPSPAATPTGSSMAPSPHLPWDQQPQPHGMHGAPPPGFSMHGAQQFAAMQQWQLMQQMQHMQQMHHIQQMQHGRPGEGPGSGGWLQRAEEGWASLESTRRARWSRRGSRACR